MLSKSQFKLINSLSKKKYRDRHGLFLAEGKKVITELLTSNLEMHSLYTTEDIFKLKGGQPVIVDHTELKKISQLSTPQIGLALFEIPRPKKLTNSGLQLALDGIRDPGNLGAIIRLCDWFGITDLVCSLDTVDCYNPKVVQASMGSLVRVSITYTNLAEFLKEVDRPVLGTFMDGASIYRQTLEPQGVIVMGNEANGISQDIEKLITQRIGIPQFGAVMETESLNVATATAIILSEFRRG